MSPGTLGAAPQPGRHTRMCVNAAVSDATIAQYFTLEALLIT
jgi:hypothetical protein